jgi:hypothetical protein
MREQKIHSPARYSTLQDEAEKSAEALLVIPERAKP